MVRRTSRTGVLLTGLFLVLLSHEPIFAFDSVVCKWHGDARGAYSMAFDDGALGQEEFAVPLLNERELRGTFFVVGFSVEAWYTVPKRLHIRELRDMARHGHEIGNHSYSHKDLRTLTDSEIRQEIERCQEYLGRYGLWPTSFAYPFSGCDERVKAIVAEYFEFARCGYPMITNSSEWLKIDPFHLKWSDSPDHYACLSVAAEQGEWAIGVFHQVGYDGPTVSAFEQFVDTVASLRDSNQLWVDTVTNVGRYIRERAYAQLTSKTIDDGNAIELTLRVTSACPSPLVPLTVKTDISGMYVASITQAEHPIGFTMSETSEQRFVICEVLPDAGVVRIELTKNVAD